MGEYRTVTRLQELPEGEPARFEVDDVELVLIRQDGQVHALENRCSHEDFPLSEGELLNGQIECALHGARFDLESGDARALPAVRPVKTFDCRVEDDEVQVRLED